MKSQHILHILCAGLDDKHFFRQTESSQWVRCVTPAKLFAPLSATQPPLKRASMPRKNETLHPPYVYIGAKCTCTVVPVSILRDAFSKKDVLYMML